jgi:NADP-dependent 3-hydroxy acid dehydrogenase YdfG
MPRFDPHPERRAAVVTGASSGIGEATAVRLAAAGHPVVLGARRLERLEATAERIREEGGEALALALDLTDPGSVEAFAKEADARLGPIEVLVSNAGDVRPATAIGVSPEEFERLVRVNLLGPQALFHHLVPAMVARGRGDVVVVTSDVVVRPRTHMAGYVASKWGLEGLVTALRMELEGTGVRVGAVRPGPSSTEQGTTWTHDEVVEVMGSWAQWGFLRHDGGLRPREIAEAIAHVVATPRGTNLAIVEIQPEAPRRDPQ